MPSVEKGRREEASGARWMNLLGYLTTGLLLFETLTGLIIYLLPFSLTTQFSVHLHTAIGIPFLLPITWYLIRHWLDYRPHPMNHYKATGYGALVALLACCVSGIVLTYQAIFGTRISYGWQTIHIISTFAIIAFTVPHVALLIVRDRRREDRIIRDGVGRYVRGTLATAGVAFILLLATVLAYEAPVLNNEFPDDYNYAYGEDRPFAPSLATTVSQGAYDESSLSGSFGCGAVRCHEQIVEEWSVSAHRWSSMDLAFQTVQGHMADQNGPESTRYCGGCHDPISLFAGTKNIGVEKEHLSSLHGYNEGVSCLVCHAIRETDVKGNAAYKISQLPRYAFEMHEGEIARFLSHFLIRAYPRYHVDSLGKRLFKTPEYCAACHKQFIDQEVNNVGWVQLQNQFDNWRKSRWNTPGHADKTIECRECHMPLVSDSVDPASGDALDYNRSPDDGKHRSHRFVAANQLMPVLLKDHLPGWEKQVELTEKWLQGKYEIPEIADKWMAGAAVPVEIQAPEHVTPGEKIDIRVSITSNKVGHDFPTGPLDIIQAWVELEVKDDAGKIVFISGDVDERNFIDSGSFIFKAEAVDAKGSLIDKHNLWEMVGVRYRRALFPGFEDAAQYSFLCPSALTTEAPRPLDNEDFSFEAPPGGAGKLHVKARLRYRKVDQFLLNFLYGSGQDVDLTSPITDMSWDEAVISVVPSG